MATKKKAKPKKRPSAQTELMFEEPPPSDRKPKRKRKKRLSQGDVRTYNTKSGHTYELRRVK